MRENLRDEVLVGEFNKGKVETFGILFERYKKGIFNLCLRMLGKYEEAEDITQDIFVKVYENLNSFKGESSFKTWLYRIGTTTCIDSLRKRKSFWNYLSKMTKMNEQKIENIPEYGEKEWVQKILKTLPENQRLMLILRYVQGFSSKETAEILNCSEGSLKVKLFRARENFKKQSEKYLKEGVSNEM